MYAATSLRDAYRKFRAKAPSFLYAFGQQAFFVFVMGDAHGKLQYANVRVTMSKTPSDYRANLNNGSETANRCF